MHRWLRSRGLVACLALLPLSCAQQLRDDPTEDLGAGDDAGDPDAKAAPGDETSTDDVGKGDDAPTAAGDDAGYPDDAGNGTPDVGVTTPDDTGSAPDTGPMDVGTPDAGTPDVGTPDVGTRDVGTPDVGTPDVGTPDTGPHCTAAQTACGGVCVNTQTSVTNCGGCARTCATGQSCVAGVCTLVCATPTVVCGTACVNTQTDATNCGACSHLCGTGARCTAGRCVGGVITGTPFSVTLTPNNCSTVDHLAITGDDRGGIAVSNARLFYSGDDSTGRFDLNTLVGETVGRIYDGLASDLATGALYTLADGSTPLTLAGGTFTSLIALDPATGGLTDGLINLSQPIDMPAGSVGIFSGYERLIIMAAGRAWHVSLPSGAVIDLGAVALPAARVACDNHNWAIWGVAEFSGGALSIDYVQSATVVARMRVPEATVTTLATFTNLGDMCSFTVSPLWRRWYFHHENNSQFRTGGAEVAGYCDATVTGPTTLPCRPIDMMCGGVCTNTQTSAANCGMCGHACAAGQACTAGVCGLSCPAAQTACAGACVDTNVDPANCGACGRACAGGQWCVAGACGGGPHYAVDTSLTQAAVPYVDACSAAGSVHLLQYADDDIETATLPFATHWWGALLPAGSPMTVSSNGNVQVNVSSGDDGYLGRAIPSTATPNSLLAPQWNDLVLSSQGVCVATVGSAPSRRWVAQWVGPSYYADTNVLNFEVAVYEGSGIVDFVYGAMSGVTASTVGLENNDGTDGIGGCGSATCTQVSNSRIRFTPIP